MANLVGALEEKLGVPEERFVRLPVVVDYRVFVSAYEITHYGICP